MFVYFFLPRLIIFCISFSIHSYVPQVNQIIGRKKTGRNLNASIYIQSISSENIPCIDFVLHVVEAGVVAVGDDGLTSVLELGEVVDHFAAEECAAVFKRWFVDDDCRTFGLDALHHALDG